MAGETDLEKAQEDQHGSDPSAASSSTTTSTHSKTHAIQSPQQQQHPRLLARLKSSSRPYLASTLTANDATLPLAWMSMLTGLVDGLIYSRATVWVGFMTGTTVQLGQNIAQYIYPVSASERDPLLTVERFLALCAFFTGSFVGSEIGKRMGEKTRGYLMLNSLLQGLTMFAAAGILLSRPEEEGPTWRYYPPVVVLAAMSMGLQSIAAQKMASPAFSTSVAFTATLTQIASDPHLFSFSVCFPNPLRLFSLSRDPASSSKPSPTSSRKSRFFSNPSVRGRDLRILAIAAVAFGGGLSQSLVKTSIGLRGSLAVAAACKIFLVVLWAVIRVQEKPKVQTNIQTQPATAAATTATATTGGTSTAAISTPTPTAIPTTASSPPPSSSTGNDTPPSQPPINPEVLAHSSAVQQRQDQLAART